VEKNDTSLQVSRRFALVLLAGGEEVEQNQKLTDHHSSTSDQTSVAPKPVFYHPTTMSNEGTIRRSSRRGAKKREYSAGDLVEIHDVSLVQVLVVSVHHVG